MKPLTETEQRLLAEIKTTFGDKPFDTTDIALASLHADSIPALMPQCAHFSPIGLHAIDRKHLNLTSSASPKKPALTTVQPVNGCCRRAAAGRSSR
jgi:hypothetical protein